MKPKFAMMFFLCALLCGGLAFGQAGDPKLDRWLERFPAADSDHDGHLSQAEADAFVEKVREARKASIGKDGRPRQAGAPRDFEVDPGWKAEGFPAHAVFHRTPKEIAAAYEAVPNLAGPVVTSYEKPSDASLRIVGTGHSFMAPGYTTFPIIARASGLAPPPLLTHLGPGITGSTRFKWEQENGIFQFDGEATPKLLASIANAKWDVMMWGPYFKDEPEYYTCWIDFCLKYNPGMKFYLADIWPQLDQLDKIPISEEALSDSVIGRMGREQEKLNTDILGELNKKYPGKVFALPVCRAMVIAAQYYHRGELPGVEGIHTYVGKKERSLWRDRLGHIGPGFGDLEGYVFYATVYGRSPELIEGDIDFGKAGDYPSKALDRVFRKIAWEAVVGNPRSGVVDKDGDGVGDGRE